MVQSVLLPFLVFCRLRTLIKVKLIRFHIAFNLKLLGEAVKRHDISRQARLGFGLFLVVALVGAVISMLATLYLAHAGLKLGRDISPLSQATLKVRLSVSEAHLLVEEIMGGG